MSSFAEIDENNIVLRVLVVGQEFINTGVLGDPSKWIQTSYNTYKGEHKHGGTPLRKNFAGIGFLYDSVKDAFIPPKPYPSWVLNEDECQWYAPTPYPGESVQEDFEWDEDNLVWKEIDFSTKE